jgi:glutaredoxin
MTVTIYGTKGCSKCKQLEKTCINNNYSIIYKNVEPGDQDFKKLIANGVKAFPAIEINSEIIHGKELPDYVNIIQINQ